MSYTKTIWEDLPSTNTPLNATNLNNIEDGIETLESEIIDKNTYSTTEKVVGTSVDGKPIYRITLVYTLNTGNSNYDISSLNIDTVVLENHQCKRISGTGNVDFENPYYASSTDYFRVFIRIATNTIETRLQSSYVSFTQISTIEYTKTTD